MPGTRVSQEELEVILDLFSRGITLKDIGKQLHRTEETIGRVLQRVGVWKGRSYIDPELLDMALRMQEENITLPEIAEELGVSYNFLYHRLRKDGLFNNPPMSSWVKISNLDHISEQWWSEFRGFFYGEGTITLRYGTHGNMSFAIRILLRDDDQLVLQDIHQKLGGSFLWHTPVQKSRKSNPHCVWYITGLGKMLPVLEHLEQGLLPAKKKRDVVIAKDFCQWRLSLPKQLTEEEKVIADQFVQKLHDIKVYKAY